MDVIVGDNADELFGDRMILTFTTSIFKRVVLHCSKLATCGLNLRGSGASDGDILGVKLKSKGHIHNRRIFQEVFGDLSIQPRTKERYPIGYRRGSVSCCFEVDEQFCHLCDEDPAQYPEKT